MEKVRPPRWTGWPLKTAGDKGYSYPRVREWLERRGIEAVIPQRSDQIEHEGHRLLDRKAYRRRSKVENSVGWLKENRRVGSRYDKLANSFLAFVNLAIIRRATCGSWPRMIRQTEPSGKWHALCLDPTC
jgi:hypothetical protein